jgi:hypothetical protein
LQRHCKLIVVEDINESNPLGTKGQLAKEFGGLLKELWSGKYIYVVPRDFKKTLVKISTICSF